MSQLVPYLNFGLEDSQLCPEDSYYSYDFIDNNPKMFITLEGLNSGVPTRTTPTLTPTTLRNIEQTFIELQSKPESHENEAGFVPPLVPPIGNNQYIPISEVDIYSKSSSSPWHSSISPHSQDSNSRPTPPVTPKNNGMNVVMTTEPTGRRNMGGRKPAKTLDLSPEEEERRRIRRERNKMAAARCRKRRVDHTNTLIAETESLEQMKQTLENEIRELKAEKYDLELCLQSHCGSQFCRRNRPPSPPDVKPYDIPPPVSSEERVKTELIETVPPPPHTTATSIFNNNNDNIADYFTAPNPAKRIMLSSTVPIAKPNRPSSLNVTTFPLLNTKINNITELAGVTISTPTTGIQLNFDSMMSGGSGLTPVSLPTPLVQCSTQQRNNGGSVGVVTDSIGSSDGCTGGGAPPKLVSL